MRITALLSVAAGVLSTSSALRFSLRARTSKTAWKMEAVAAGDVVTCFGSTGGVGRLVVERLATLGTYQIRTVVRDASKAQTLLGSLPGVEIVRGDLRDPGSLESALAGTSAVIACTGTTAFPSSRWGGGNTPDAVDNVGVAALAKAASGVSGLKRFLFLSSVGVERRGKPPFSILNAFGVLDAKAKGEEHIMAAAAASGFAYSVLRPGRLIGEPFTNPDVATLFKTKPATKLAVQMRCGDSLAGDIARGCVAEAFVQALTQQGAENKAYNLINVEGPLLSQEEWDKAFAEL